MFNYSNVQNKYLLKICIIWINSSIAFQDIAWITYGTNHITGKILINLKNKKCVLVLIMFCFCNSLVIKWNIGICQNAIQIIVQYWYFLFFNLNLSSLSSCLHFHMFTNLHSFFFVLVRLQLINILKPRVAYIKRALFIRVGRSL